MSEQLCGSSIMYCMCRFGNPPDGSAPPLPCKAPPIAYRACEYHDGYGLKHAELKRLTVPARDENLPRQPHPGPSGVPEIRSPTEPEISW